MIIFSRLFPICIAVFFFFTQSVFGETKIVLSESEKEYLKNLGTVKMCVDPDWEPFEKINKNGEHEGIGADLVRLVFSRAGVALELYPTKDWDASIEASKSGKCHIMSFLNKTVKREEWLTFTDPIFYDPNVLITREEHPFISDPQSLYDETIVFPVGTSMEERVRRDYPNLKIFLVQSEAEAIDAVSNKNADMTMRSLIVAAYTIKKEGLFNLKIAGQLPNYTNELRIGVLKTEPMLQEILNKAVKTITPQEREQIVNKHISIKVQKGIDYKLIGEIIFVFLLILLAGYYWNRKLKSEIKKATQKIEEQNKIILDRTRKAAMGEMIAVIAHQLKQPLSSIGLLTELVKESEDAEEKGQHVDKMSELVEYMSQTIDGYLKFFNPNQKPEIFFVAHAIALAIKMTQNKLNRRNVTLGTEIDETIQVFGFTKDIEQIVSNIVSNASDAAEEREVKNPRIEVRLSRRGENAILEIHDNCGGIEDSILNKVFDPYFSTKGEKGSGIGLSLVKMLVEERLKGAIKVYNNNEGASFEITLQTAK